MTKEDYMKLSKERLAELLAERDAQEALRQIPMTMPVAPTSFPPGTPLCPFGGACTNKFRDCVNCPGVITDGSYTINYDTKTDLTTSK